MKKSLLAVLASGILVLGMMGNAQATTIFYEDLYIPGTDYLMSEAGAGQVKVHNWTFNITDSLDWTTAGQVFNNGTITLVVEDDKGSGDGKEKATFEFETGTGLTDSEISASAWDGVFSVNSSAFNDGLITATLTTTTGDFYFRSALLNVKSEVSARRDPLSSLSQTDLTPVPEPSTVVLLGSGLVGLFYIGRKKSRKL